MSRADYYEQLAQQWGYSSALMVNRCVASYWVFNETDRVELVNRVRMAAHFGQVALSSREKGR